MQRTNAYADHVAAAGGRIVDAVTSGRTAVAALHVRHLFQFAPVAALMAAHEWCNVPKETGIPGWRRSVQAASDLRGELVDSLREASSLAANGLVRLFRDTCENTVSERGCRELEARMRELDDDGPSGPSMNSATKRREMLFQASGDQAIVLNPTLTALLACADTGHYRHALDDWRDLVASFPAGNHSPGVTRKDVILTTQVLWEMHFGTRNQLHDDILSALDQLATAEPRPNQPGDLLRGIMARRRGGKPEPEPG